MIIKQTKELKILAKAANKTEIEFSEMLVSELIEKDFISNSPDMYGARINEVCTPTVMQLANIVEKIGLPTRGEFLLMVYKLILLGENDCPECGGEMVEDEEKSEFQLIAGDTMTPDDWEPIKIVYKCSCCDYSE